MQFKVRKEGEDRNAFSDDFAGAIEKIGAAANLPARTAVSAGEAIASTALGAPKLDLYKLAKTGLSGIPVIGKVAEYLPEELPLSIPGAIGLKAAEAISGKKLPEFPNRAGSAQIAQARKEAFPSLEPQSKAASAWDEFVRDTTLIMLNPGQALTRSGLLKAATRSASSVAAGTAVKELTGSELAKQATKFGVNTAITIGSYLPTVRAQVKDNVADNYSSIYDKSKNIKVDAEPLINKLDGFEKTVQARNTPWRDWMLERVKEAKRTLSGGEEAYSKAIKAAEKSAGPSSILDEFGNPIMKEVRKIPRSLKKIPASNIVRAKADNNSWFNEIPDNKDAKQTFNQLNEIMRSGAQNSLSKNQDLLNLYNSTEETFGNLQKYSTLTQFLQKNVNAKAVYNPLTKALVTGTIYHTGPVKAGAILGGAVLAREGMEFYDLMRNVPEAKKLFMQLLSQSAKNEGQKALKTIIRFDKLADRNTFGPMKFTTR